MIIVHIVTFTYKYFIRLKVSYRLSCVMTTVLKRRLLLPTYSSDVTCWSLLPYVTCINVYYPHMCLSCHNNKSFLFQNGIKVCTQRIWSLNGFDKMSQQRCFSIIGDSNVSRNMTALNRRASPLMEECQVISCRKLSGFADSLRSLRASSNSCIVACLTNFFTDVSTRGSPDAASRLEPVFEEIRAVLADYVTANPDIMMFVSPPMYRQLPEWYRNSLPKLLPQFSKALSALRSPGFHLLPSLQTQDLEDDGIHLTPYSGLKYVVHLFDSSLDVIKGLSATLPAVVSAVSESTRALEDRVVVLEHDQRHLRQKLQLKTAVDAELADFEENVRNECYFVIAGLPPVPAELIGREWQNHAKDLVQSKIKLILGRESRIIVVSGLRRDANPIYLVKLESADDSKRIRDRCGSSG